MEFLPNRRKKAGNLFRFPVRCAAVLAAVISLRLGSDRKEPYKGLVAVIIACVLTLCTVMPAFASSSFAVDQELSKTGTIYETVSFTSLSTSQMDSNREFKAMQSELPEFKEIEFDRDTSSANYKMEVRYASVYTVSQDEARKYGYEKYQNVIKEEVPKITIQQALQVAHYRDMMRMQL